MATIQSVKEKIQGLIDKANETTTASDMDLTTAINTLIEGYGKGGGLDDEYLKYFSYTIDQSTATILLYSIHYDKIYEDTGSYDVTIPDTIAGMNVIIVSGD